jgi:hypothetical protein
MKPKVGQQHIERMYVKVNWDLVSALSCLVWQKKNVARCNIPTRQLILGHVHSAKFAKIEILLCP